MNGLRFFFTILITSQMLERGKVYTRSVMKQKKSHRVSDDVWLRHAGDLPKCHDGDASTTQPLWSSLARTGSF